ncbi:MAG: hypothetical protein IJ638_04345 [Alphaproteobacteria bacterium]|nr:hypothetical protein [Alphaproteobacteria bacterium]
MKKYLLLSLLLLGCNQLLKTNVYTNDIPDSKVFAITGKTKYMPELRSALEDAGYTVLKDSQVRQISKKTKFGTEKQSNYTSRYVIDIVNVKEVATCTFNTGVKYIDMDLEITDVKQNKVIMYVKAGGRTGDCFGSLISPNFFTEEIIPEINSVFGLVHSDKNLKGYDNFDQ